MDLSRYLFVHKIVHWRKFTEIKWYAGIMPGHYAPLLTVTLLSDIYMYICMYVYIYNYHPLGAFYIFFYSTLYHLHSMLIIQPSHTYAI